MTEIFLKASRNGSYLRHALPPSDLLQNETQFIYVTYIGVLCLCYIIQFNNILLLGVVRMSILTEAIKKDGIGVFWMTSYHSS